MTDKKEAPLTESEHFHIRVDEDPTYTSDKIVMWIARQNTSIQKYIFAKEGNGGTIKFHYHLYICYFKIMKKDAVEKRFKRYFEIKGTKSSVMPCRKPEQTKVYVVKEGKIIKYKGFTSEDIEDLKARSYLKDKKPSSFKILEQKVRKKYKHPTEEEIMGEVFNYYKGDRHYYNHMVAMVRGLQAVFNEEDAFDRFVNYCRK